MIRDGVEPGDPAPDGAETDGAETGGAETGGAASGKVRIGTAGWGIPPQYAVEFPGDGSHLQRYAGRLSAVEINSSFYRPHRVATFRRWASSVPASMRFAVKVPKDITHARRLVDTAAPLDRFLSEASGLGLALGPLLVQLPPGLSLDERVSARFFDTLRARFAGPVVCEPRHPTWFTPAAGAILAQFGIARAAADPACVPSAGEPGGSSRLAYFRLHGSPEMYYSAYLPEYLERLARRIADAAVEAEEVWCIFDNTARGEAARNALDLMAALATPSP